MASIHMKCHECGKELKADPCADWAIGERKQHTYFCHNRSYSNGCGGPEHAKIELVLPDEEIFSYKLTMLHKNSIYHIEGWLCSILPFSSFPRTTISKVITNIGDPYHSFSEIFTMDKAYPLLWNQDLKSQSDFIFSKLKGLVIFA